MRFESIQGLDEEGSGIEGSKLGHERAELCIQGVLKGEQLVLFIAMW